MILKSLFAALAAFAMAAACTPGGRDKIINVDGDAFLGPADAKVTVIEYGSPTCPGCKFWHDTFLEEMKRDYIASGKVKFIFREFAVHGAIDAAIFSLARCAGKDDYFKVLDEAFASQREIVLSAQRGDSIAEMQKLGGKFQLSPDQVKACMNDPANIRRINDVSAYSKQIGVSSTPTFFVDGVEMTEPDLSKVWLAIKAAIDAALSGAPIAPTPIASPAGAGAPPGDGHAHAPGETH
jgi:protein-disulfide isomerase